MARFPTLGSNPRWTARLALAALVGACLLGLAWGCANNIVGSDLNTSLEVLVTKGPLQPVVMEGETNSEPVQGALVEVTRFGSSSRLTERTGSDGIALFFVRAGSYMVRVLECGAALELPLPATVSVESGATTNLQMECDTGIR